MSKKDPVGIEIFGDAAKSSTKVSTSSSTKSGKKSASKSASAGLQPSKSQPSKSESDTSVTGTSGTGASGTGKRKTRWLGVTALVIALAFAVADGYAVAVAIGDYYELAILLAVVATVGTVIAFLLGAVALVLGRGRWFGLAAMVLSVLANPFTLVQLLIFFSDFTAS